MSHGEGEKIRRKEEEVRRKIMGKKQKEKED